MPGTLCAALAAACAVLATARAGSSQPAPSDPSFGCAHVSSQVNRLVCTTPDLAALDRQLAVVFDNMMGQASTDPKALRAEEAVWLRSMRARCSDALCIRAAYRERIAELKDRSLRAASPAAYAETRPFPATSAAMAAARGLVGQRCSAYFARGGARIPGFASVPGFRSVTLPESTAVPVTKSGVRFVFLLSEPDGDLSKCRVADVTALPPPAKPEAFLACSEPDATSSSPDSVGVGLRQQDRAAYWEVDARTGKLVRQPLGVLGWARSLRCTAPETGE